MQILEIAKKYNLLNKTILYGNDIAKIKLDNTKKQSSKQGKLILVTAMTSNSSGIGKTTISIGLADALNKLNQKTMLALREPSLGPVFGVKGGATGGGKSVIEPSDKINLHFTGDFHAITMANNLLSSIIDNHIYQGNQLNIDPTKIFFKRCIDINDRSLRNITYNIHSQQIETGFNITAASEIMAILSLSKNLDDLKQNLGNILVALTKNNKPIFAKDLSAQESMTALLKDAICPNLVQTKFGTPAVVHLGPFANIAHGCNSIIATDLALKSAKYCVTEAGFGSDLGAEKFLDIVCRKLSTRPDACVLVVTIDVIKQHGNGDLQKGFLNVARHIDILKNQFCLPCVVAINFHKTDKLADIKLVKEMCQKCGVKAITAKAYTAGATGCIDLAKEVITLSATTNNFKFCYNLEDDIKTKINKIATKIYGAKNVEFTPLAKEKLALAHKLKFDNFFVCIAKTQFSFTDNKNLIGAPTNFTLTITDIDLRSGAKMIVPIAGNMLLLPGLTKNSNYQNIKVENDKIINLL